MSFLETTPGDQAQGRVGELYEADRARLGYVANYTKVFALRPDAYQAWMGLSGAIRAAMDLRRFELATLGAARRLRSSYCMLAHGKVLRDRFFEWATVRDIALDHRSAPLDPVDVAVMDLAEKVADDATSVGEEDIERLRRLGLSDADILDVVLAAAARCFSARSWTPPEPSPIRLTVGWSRNCEKP